MTTRLTILSQIKQVAEEQKKTLAPLTDDLPLIELASIPSVSPFWWRGSKMQRASIPSPRLRTSGFPIRLAN